MRKNFIRFLLILTILAGVVNAQDSVSIKKVKGVDYYSYTVQQGEGLYSISKRFGVSQADINNLNPQIHDGLQAGQEIIIPIAKKINEIKKTDKQSTSKGTEVKPATTTPDYTFISHVVQKKQTVFAICKKYNISQDDLLQFNPQVKNGLQEGMTLKIPVISKKAEKEAQKQKKETIDISSTKQSETERHTVQQGETLYSIARENNVSVDELTKLNPEAASNLKTGSEILIPRKKATQKAESENISTPVLKYKKYNQQPLKIAFLLPYMTNSDKQDSGNDRFVDFYAGALLAINEAKQKGISFEIYAYDTEKSEDKISEVLTNNKASLSSADLIIGPAYSNQVQFVSDFARENKINTVIPFSSKVYDISYNPYLFQFNPSNEISVDFMADHIESQYRNAKILFLNLPDVSITDDGYDFSLNLQRKLTEKKISFEEKEMDSPDQIQNLIVSNKKTLIIFNTDKYSMAGNYMKSIGNYASDDKITVYTQYSWPAIKSKSYKTISVSPFKSLKNEAGYNNYQQLFAQYFDWSPSSVNPRFDLLGYDIMNFFINQIVNSGAQFNMEPKLQALPGIQSQIKFERLNNESGYMNHQLYISTSTAE